MKKNILILITVIMVALICLITPKIDQNTKFISDEASVLEKGWSVRVDGVLIYDDFTLPKKINAHTNSEIDLETKLPSKFVSGMTIAFRSAQQLVKVEAGDDCIYTYGYDRIGKLGKAPGSVWNVVRIPEKCEGSRLRISFQSPYADYSGRLPEIYYGSKSGVVSKIVGDSLLGLVASFMIALSAITLIILSIISRKLKSNLGIIPLAMFGLASFVWTFTESRLTQLFFNNSILILNVACISLMVMPIFALKYIIVNYKGLNSQLLKTLKMFLWIAFLGIMVLQLLNIVDFIVTINFYNSLMFVCGLVVFIHLILVNKKVKSSKIKLLRNCFFIIFLSGILELINFAAPMVNNNSMFFKTAVFVVLTVFAVKAYENIYIQVKEKCYIETLETLAYSDGLTGIKNRASYEKTIGKIEKSKNLDTLTVLAFDVNNLKYVNDNFGHVAGDELIIGSCEIIKEYYGENINLFRTGGDEFMILDNSDNKDKLYKNTEKFIAKADSFWNRNGAVLSIAVGIAVYEKNKDENIYDVIKRADSEMYIRKKEMKEKHK